MTSAIGKRSGISRRNGFTLIELMVVLAIMVLLMSLIPLALNQFLPGRRVRVAADQLVADVRWLQVQSSARRTIVHVHITGSGYVLGCREMPTLRLAKFSASTSIILRSPFQSGRYERLLIYPDGTTSGGRFEISDSGRNAVIEVSMLTGKATRVI